MPRMSRKTRGQLIQRKMKASRLRNGELKLKERARRENRIKELLRKGKLPYTPVVMSWLSAHLGKPSTRITQADVNTVLKG
ncbi:MAG TPA: hypothetical protein VGZ47_23155 [Gemmataceae bacterium]|nr:hypothetical protein [Gemmataceae bacterium]